MRTSPLVLPAVNIKWLPKTEPLAGGSQWPKKWSKKWPFAAYFGPSHRNNDSSLTSNNQASNKQPAPIKISSQTHRFCSECQCLVAFDCKFAIKQLLSSPKRHATFRSQDIVLWSGSAVKPRAGRRRASMRTQKTLWHNAAPYHTTPLFVCLHLCHHKMHAFFCSSVVCCMPVAALSSVCVVLFSQVCAHCCQHGNFAKARYATLRGFI